MTMSRALPRHPANWRKSASFVETLETTIAAIQSLCEVSLVGSAKAVLSTNHFRTPSPDGRRSNFDLPLVYLWEAAFRTGKNRRGVGKGLREQGGISAEGFRLGQCRAHSTYLSKEAFEWTSKQSVLQLRHHYPSRPVVTRWANRLLWAGLWAPAPLRCWKATSSPARPSERQATCFTASASPSAAELIETAGSDRARAREIPKSTRAGSGLCACFLLDV